MTWAKLMIEFTQIASPDQLHAVGTLFIQAAEQKRLSEVMPDVVHDQRTNPLTDAMPKIGGAPQQARRTTTEGYDEVIAAGAVSLQPGG